MLNIAEINRRLERYSQFVKTSVGDEPGNMDTIAIALFTTNTGPQGMKAILVVNGDIEDIGGKKVIFDYFADGAQRHVESELQPDSSGGYRSQYGWGGKDTYYATALVPNFDASGKLRAQIVSS